MVNVEIVFLKIFNLEIKSLRILLQSKIDLNLLSRLNDPTFSSRTSPEEPDKISLWFFKTGESACSLVLNQDILDYPLKTRTMETLGLAA